MSLFQVGNALVPVLVGSIVDRAVGGGNFRDLVGWTVALGCNFAVLLLAYQIGSRLEVLGTQLIQHQFRRRIVDRVLSPYRGDKLEQLPGTTLAIITNDVYRVASVVGLGVQSVGYLAAIFVGGVILMYIAWPVGVAVLFGAPVILFLLDRVGEMLRRQSLEEHTYVAKASGHAADYLEGYRVLKGIRAEMSAANHYRRESERALTSALKSRTMTGIQIGVFDTINTLFIAGVATCAGILALNGAMTVGELITVVGLTQFLISPLTSLPRQLAAYWPPALASVERIKEILQVEHSGDGGEPPGRDEDSCAALILDHLFAGPISGLTLRITPGECLGIEADPEIASVLAEVLALKRRPDGGEVRYGRLQFAGGRAEDVRRQVLVAPRHADIFEGPLVDNVLYGSKPSEGRDECNLEQALEAVGCRSLLDSLPLRGSTPVGEAGSGLSGGERQRIALARAVAANPRVLVLHDPTTAIDSVTEAQIASCLREARRSSITILITRSPALLATTDRVVTLRDSHGDGS